MEAQAGPCKCEYPPEPLSPAYSKYRCRAELRQLAPLVLPLYDKYQISSAGQIFILAFYKFRFMSFHLKAIMFILFLLSKNKSEIRFQYLVLTY